MEQDRQIGCGVAGIPSPAAPRFTCVSVVVQSEGLVAVLVVAQWGQRGQTGVKSSLEGGHVDRGLRRSAALGEVLGPLGLAHQAFHGREDRSHDVT